MICKTEKHENSCIFAERKNPAIIYCKFRECGRIINRGYTYFASCKYNHFSCIVCGYGIGIQHKLCARLFSSCLKANF